MPLLGFLVGAFIGAALGNRLESIVLGAIVGLIAGIIGGEWRQRRRQAAPASAAAAAPDSRVARLEHRVAALEAAMVRAGLAAPDAAAASPAAASTVANATADAAPAPMVGVAPDAAAIATVAPAAHPVESATAVASVAQDGAAPPVVAPPRVPNPVWAWLRGGNTPARVGVVVLFIGVGFLLKYAAEHARLPIELRLAGVALGAVALLVTGWRLRTRRHAYAMVLQGGGVGVLYLVVFAALRLYALIPAAAAFPLLVAIAALAAVLAIRQDAVSLAAAGAIGGFLAPILAAGPDGSHVVLFAYYAILNAGILGIAWFKAWRALNLIGFAFTFVIAALWGATRYRAADFATTEPFLVLFFLFYVGIAVLYAMRRSLEIRRYVDATLVFGTPLAAAGLQQALVRDTEFGMAFSAVAASALYCALARVLWSRRRDDLRLLVEAFLALGVVFATLAVPFAFGARWTSATWALEGAAIAWLGLRQQRVGARTFGVALQLAAGVAYALGSAREAPTILPLANNAFVGATLVALAAVATARLYARSRDSLRAPERVVAPLAFAWGVMWWLGAGSQEIDRLASPLDEPWLLAAFAAASAIAFAVAARRLAWPMARMPAMLVGPALLLGALSVGAAGGVPPGGHLFARGGIVAWPLAIAAVGALLWRFGRDGAFAPDSPAMRGAHAVWLWLCALVVAHEAAWLAARLGVGDAWRDVAWGLAPALALAVVARLARQAAWPVAPDPRAYLVVGAIPLAAWMLAWTLAVGIGSAADPAPLPYVPLANPVDLGVGFVAVALVAWLRTMAREGIDLRAPRAALAALAAALAFLWIDATVLRTLHHWLGIDWSLPAMWRSTLVQTVLSILWAGIALAAMVAANRRAAYAPWIAGAVLLGLVVLKLFVIDLSSIGAIERIVSFIGVGLLLLVIGYLAPVPPRRKEQAT